MARPNYNTMSFSDDPAEMAPAPVLPADSVEKKFKKDKTEKNIKKNKRKGTQSGHRSAEVTQTPDMSAFNGMKNEEKRSKEDHAGESVPKKKRKRESEVQPSSPLQLRATQGKNTPLLHAGFLESLKKTMGDLSASFSQTATPTQNAEQPALKKRKSKVDVGSPFKRPTKYDEHGQKMPKKRGRPSNVELGGAEARASRTPKKDMKELEQAESMRGRVTAKDSPKKRSVSMPAPNTPPGPMRSKTPIPLPHNTPTKESVSSKNWPSEKEPRKLDKAKHQASDILVAETPPSRQTPVISVNQVAPVPFKLAPKPSFEKPNVPKKAKRKYAIDLLPSSPVTETGPPSSVPSVQRKALSNSRDAFTSETLMQYKQPLADKPSKSNTKNNRFSRASSTASSLSASITDYYAPIGKTPTLLQPPNPTSSSPTPILSTTKSPRQALRFEPTIDTHEEAPFASFLHAYTTSQNTINFTDELAYLHDYTQWHTSYHKSGPLPCLHLSTGCNAKREQILSLSKSDPSNLLKVSLAEAHSDDIPALSHTISSVNTALRFLTHAVRARVPVPLGVVAGTWKLYCPKYADTHVDRYAFGQRTLSISALTSGAALDKGQGPTYTARLATPPRSMAFTVTSFYAPPHASFRGVRVKTVKEGYGMEIVFLGNGYLSLRVDLHLLLMGRPGAGGKGTMEFLGVHERAVVWEEMKEE